MFNKAKKYILATVLVLLFWGIFSQWQHYFSIWDTPGELSSSNPYHPDSRIGDTECDSTNLWDCVVIKDPDNNQSIINRLLEVFWLSNDALWWDHKFIAYLRWILNIALWLLSFIALIMSIYTFYLMFFTENEAWIKKAKWNLIGIFIALATIWLARLIVSFIFRWYQKNWQEQWMGILWGTPQAMNHTLQKDEIYNII